MNILYNILNRFRTKGQAVLDKRDLMDFTMNLIREADRLERLNDGTPGRAAIEFLLNIKYAIVENRKIDDLSKEQMLDRVDSVLDKVAAKNKVQRKGREFIFTEELIITHPECAIGKEQILYCKIQALQSEIESLKIQLARTPLQSSMTIKIKDEILLKEKTIQAMKRDLQMLKYFKTWGCSSISDLRNTRDIGEKVMSTEKADKLSSRILEKLNKLNKIQEDGGRNRQLIKSAGLLGAGIGGAAGLLTGKGPGMVGGGLKGVIAGSVAALLLAGGSGLAQLIRKGKDDPAKTKASIKRVVARAEQSQQLTSTDKAKIRNNGKAVIAKLDTMNKKHESLENTNTSKGKAILEKLDSILELKKSTVAGGAAGAVAGNIIARKKALKGFDGKMLKAAKADVKRTSDIAKGAAQKAKALSKGGLVHKLKNAGQISRAKNAAKIAGSRAGQAAKTLKTATKAISKAGMKGGVKGALIGAAATAGAAGLAKALKNRQAKKDKLSSKILEKLDKFANK